MQKIVIGVIALLILAGLIFYVTSSESEAPKVAEKELRIGYIVYDPLLMKDGKTGALSGVSYDIVELVAKELGYKTNWVEEVGWGTSLEGLATGRYDILGTQMWPNEAREKAAVFSKAPISTGIYPYVKEGEKRFDPNNLKAINSSKYKVAVIDGSMDMFIAKEDYPQAELVALPQLASFSEIYLNITQGKADISFTDPSAAELFNKSNDVKVVKLGTVPVRSFSNSFALKKDNTALLNEWNAGLSKVMAGSEIEKILAKYGVSSHYDIVKE